MPVNVSDYVRERAAAQPEGRALIEDGVPTGTITWAELDRAVDRYASALSSLGVVAGHRVALSAINSIMSVTAYFAIVRAGLVAVPLNPRAFESETELILKDARPRIVIADQVGIEGVRKISRDGSSPKIVVSGTRAKRDEIALDALLKSASGGAPPSPTDAEALAALPYTADASGNPRGVMLTHRALIANVEQVAALEASTLDEDSVVLGLLPIFHIYALNAILGQAARRGSAVVLIDGFDPHHVLDVIQREGITNVPIAPPVIAAWAGRADLADKLAGVAYVLSGAAVLDPDLAEEFESSARKTIEQGYGMTEAAPVVATTVGVPRASGAGPKRGSVGRALSGIDLRIVDQDGLDAGIGDPGEVLLRGANLFSGYWPDGADGPDAAGWYPTGDVGIIDCDGDLTIVERLGEIVVVSGFSVYPFEVEEVLVAAPGVMAVAVIAMADEHSGQAVQAFVVPRAADADKNELVAALDAYAEDRLAPYKRPRKVVVVDNLPYAVSGKVSKGRLRAMARSEALGLG